MTGGAKIRSDLINSAKKLRTESSTKRIDKNKLGYKRPKSAVKTSIRSKKLLKYFVQAPACPCETHHHHLVSRPTITHMNEDFDEACSPNRLNKSVTFNNQVRIREYESI
jgi:hypothetical protein